MFVLCELCALSIGLGTLRINQNLFGNIKFPMNAISLKSTAWYKDFGFKILVAKSNGTKNSIELDKKYTNKIDYLISSVFLYKYKINNEWSIIPGVGYTDYKTTWKVDGKKVFWSNDKDSDISYHLSFRYEININSSIELGYTDYYRKNKTDFGKETTRGYTASFIYKF